MLSINISELIWGIINFFLLYFLLKRFLYTPLISFMDKRKQRIEEGYEDEKRALEEKEQINEQIRAAQEQSRNDARQLLGSIGEENSRLLKESVQQAQEESRNEQKLFDDGESDFRQQKQKELSACKAELAELLAEELLQD